MKIHEKLVCWMKAKELTFEEAAAATVISKGKLSDVSREEAWLSDLGHVTRLAKAINNSGYPGATIDWLLDDEAAWPPPNPDKKVWLSEPEKRLIAVARTLFGPPGEAWEEAFERLTLSGPYRVTLATIPATQGADAARPGANPNHIPRGITAVEHGRAGEDLTRQQEQEAKEKTKEARENEARGGKFGRKGKGRA